MSLFLRTSTCALGNLSLAVVIPLAAAGCERTVTPEQPTPEAWTYPSFEGDGLPASEGLDHRTYDEDSGPGGPATPPNGEGGEAPPPTLTVVDGLFGLSSDGEEGLPAGNIALLAKPLGCYDLYGGVDTGATADGVYATVIPKVGEDGAPQWVGTYRSCRAGPPCFRGYASVAGESLELGADASLTIEAHDVHYLTVSWKTAVSSGESLRFYNCGAVSAWAY